MIFRSGLFSRRDGITAQQFGEHWQRVHGELASHMPGVHKYLQNHIRERLFELSPFPDHAVDGISQQWFDDVAAMERCERSPEYAAVKRDIPNFQGAITILVFKDTVLVDGPAAGAKLLVLHKAKDGHAPGAMQAAAAGPRRHVQNIVVDRAHPVSANVPQGKVPAEAMAELWFDDAQALRSWVASDAGRAFIHGQPGLQPLAVYAVDELRIM
jgi:uncharacterized protein (TIGR02118 family)